MAIKNKIKVKYKLQGVSSIQLNNLLKKITVKRYDDALVVVILSLHKA